MPCLHWLIFCIQDENITTLDIDEISLFDVKSESEADLLLERTIPKSLQVGVMCKTVRNFFTDTNFGHAV